jgi:hypothetical protein
MTCLLKLQEMCANHWSSLLAWKQILHNTIKKPCPFEREFIALTLHKKDIFKQQTQNT